MGREGVNRLDDMSGTAGDGAAAGVGAGAGVRLRGAIFLGTPFHWADSQDATLQSYLGEGKVFENSSVAKLQAALGRASVSTLSEVKILILVSELDPQLLHETADEFEELWPGQDIQIQVLKGHNHISPQLSLGTGIDREEAWGVQVAEFLKSCASE